MRRDTHLPLSNLFQNTQKQEQTIQTILEFNSFEKFQVHSKIDLDNHSKVRRTKSFLPMGGQRIIHDSRKIVASMLQQFDFKLSFWWCAHLVIGRRAHSVPCQAKALVASREKNNIQDTCATAGDTSANPGSTTKRVQTYFVHCLFGKLADSTKVLNY